jgi:acyl-[acyl-carrier-protein]-phospholipid O-acyltransferase/long-chain-fatty-acid--[acyl-carrier-protein] ligase
MQFMRAFLTNRSSSFTYLNVTQFLGALNDHVFKFLIVYFCIDLQGVENSTIILSTTGACFVIPFLFLSATSGTLADRFSKRNIIVATKIMEVVVMGLGVAAFSFQSIWGGYAVLFLMAAQSALFGPSKYGIVPEIVHTEHIPKANGLLTCLTFVAIVVGTFLASFITELTGRNFLFASLFCMAIAVVGMFTSFCIEYTPPSGSRKKINPWFLEEIYKTTRQIRHQPSLVIAMLGSAYFLFASSFVQLNIVPYAMQSLGLTDAQGGYLFLLVAIGIGTGSVLAGKLSGTTVELGFVPLAGVGMTIACFLLDAVGHHLYLVLPTLIFTGLVGGMFLVPLDTYAQVASPNHMRGEVVATTNFIGFCGVLCSA